MSIFQLKAIKQRMTRPNVFQLNNGREYFDISMVASARRGIILRKIPHLRPLQKLQSYTDSFWE